MRRGDAEERAEGGVSGAASVEAEDELVEVGLEVFPTQAVIDAERPALEIGEDAVGPGQHDMGGHAADDMRIVRDAGSTGIPCPAVGFGGGAGGEIGLEKGMQTSCCGRRSRFRRLRRARPGGYGRWPPCCAAVWHTTARPICRSRGRAGVAVAAPRCRWNGWPSGRRPKTTGSAAAWSGA